MRFSSLGSFGRPIFFDFFFSVIQKVFDESYKTSYFKSNGKVDDPKTRGGSPMPDRRRFDSGHIQNHGRGQEYDCEAVGTGRGSLRGLSERAIPQPAMQSDPTGRGLEFRRLQRREQGRGHWPASGRRLDVDEHLRGYEADSGMEGRGPFGPDRSGFLPRSGRAVLWYGANQQRRAPCLQDGDWQRL